MAVGQVKGEALCSAVLAIWVRGVSGPLPPHLLLAQGDEVLRLGRPPVVVVAVVGALACRLGEGEDDR